MAQSKDSLLRSKQKVRSSISLLLTTSLILAATTGCSMTGLDKLRPEINMSNNMVVNPDSWISISDLEEDDGTIEDDSSRPSGTDVEDGEETNEDLIINQFAPLPYDVVSSVDYSEYLRVEVKEAILKLLEERKEEYKTLYNDIYFRVYHVGQNKSTEGSILPLQQSAVFDFLKPSPASIKTVGGNAVSDLIYTWLVKRYSNAVLKNQALQRFNDSLVGFDVNMTYEQARIDENIPSSIVSMWGASRNKTSCPTLRQLITRAQSYPWQVVPNIEFTVLTGATSFSVVTFNNVGTSTNRLPFLGGMDVSQLNKVFTPITQFQNDTEIKLEWNKKDDQSMCWAFIDNYSTTLVILATSPDNTLENVLGESTYEDISTVFSSIYSWNETEQIVEVLDSSRNVTIIQEGLGV